ncbi:MAG: Spy/CpxP family protein refolding chaperone [Ferrovibrio sp.]|uniref:Spy/CpxP family protein refolding chaperone n=1 Tax=Ferrovibrio sp. TaxID=1917215 RepID=UPI00260F7EAD|nr:Spy/CpxP family protein refolding chaperone [Ferrovibrio sp.]MCW0235111.1 Spy/CpxP family protein refolding chaperone [Ferrovibrio sp.]
MSARHLLIAASVLATGFAGGLALAQPAPLTAPPAAQEQHINHPGPARFIEGRIAFLRTELKLTPQQTPLFDTLASEMRRSATAMQEHHAQRQQASAQKQTPASALEKLELRSAMMKEAVAAQDRYLTAFRPLYQSLTEEQKQTADQLLAQGGGMGGPMGKGMMGGHHGPRHH